MKKIIFGAPFIGDEEINEVVDTLKSGWIGTGPKCFRFEKNFAKYVGAKYALAVNSCTAALHLGLLVSNIGPGDEVITTPLTFAATVNVIKHVGARPILADIELKTLNINPNLIEAKITPKTKAIIPVHFGGLPCDMDKIKKIAKKYNLIIIEDAAHAVGAKYKGKKIGSFGNLTCFSFYANKNITTGEGGMITTNDEKIAEKIKILRLHGLSTDAWKRYESKKLILSEIIYPGYKYNMTDIQASLGLHQLNKINKFLKTREAYAKIYDNVFSKLDYLRLQYRPSDIQKNRHALHLYVLILDLSKFKFARNKIIEKLNTQGIGAAIHYKAIHLHPFYKKDLSYHIGDFPVSEKVSKATISLPLTPKMSGSDAQYVARTTEKVLQSCLK
ncbi:DegT/DnrJ/EryC1/StrS family aminotransferase [Patescibacteria group bacterium]|nr:DegT/DnrJ/EryC1/StrS family aminotransferase [Patescibacteria group bacterium]MBU4511801.1 DegT/DnrJ/EryC1/StrS family aminotransferase [Patescibacteria group bacterium]